MTNFVFCCTVLDILDTLFYVHRTTTFRNQPHILNWLDAAVTVWYCIHQSKQKPKCLDIHTLSFQNSIQYIEQHKRYYINSRKENEKMGKETIWRKMFICRSFETSWSSCNRLTTCFWCKIYLLAVCFCRSSKTSWSSCNRLTTYMLLV